MSQNRARILIADDEEIVLDIISRKLTEEGYNCTTASSGEETLKKLAEYPFDLALIDIKMPDISGMEVLRDIQITSPDTAVIMITAFPDVETAVTAMKMGACDYITKPMDLDRLVTSVAIALGKRKHP